MLTKKNVRAFFHFGSRKRNKSAQNLGYVHQSRFRRSLRKVIILNLIKSSVIAQFFDQSGGFIGFRLRFAIDFKIFFGVFEGLFNVRGSDFSPRTTVIKRTACSLFVKLQNYPAERGLTATRFADEPERFALVDIYRNIFVGANVKAFLLEQGGFRYRKILFKIRDRQQFFLCVLHFFCPPF